MGEKRLNRSRQGNGKFGLPVQSVDPAIRKIAVPEHSVGPKPPFVVKAWVGTKILQQLTSSVHFSEGRGDGVVERGGHFR